MKPTLLIARRALGGLFRSPLGYVLIALFLLLTGYFFHGILLEKSVRLGLHGYRGSQPGLVCRAYWQTASLFLLFIVPIMTMGSLAGEKTGGTLELLLTSPVRFSHIILGKFVALMAFYLVMLAPTGIYFAFLRVYGGLDYGPIFAGYLGAVLLGAAMISLGVFISALTTDQIIAAFATLIALVVFWLFEVAGNGLPGFWRVLVSYFSLYVHFNRIVLGDVGLDDIVYLLSFTVFFLGASLIAIRLLWVRGKWN